jgi:murein L,D-transpeptidase YcbB/YkuD
MPTGRAVANFPGEAAAAHLEAVLAKSAPGALGARLRERDALVRFYAARNWKLAWSDLGEQGGPALLRAVRGVADHGLAPERYHEQALEEAPAPPLDPEREAQLDLLRSDAFLLLGRDLAAGAVDPRALHPGYARADEPADPVAALRAALRDRDVSGALAELAPPHVEYAALRATLPRLRAEAAGGDGPPVPGGRMVKPGQHSARVPALRARLAWPEAPTLPAEGDPERLDPALAEALRGFQARHGLNPDAILGPLTSAALAESRAQRVDRVRANLERWRWQPRDLGARSVRVNVASFGLRTWDGDQPALSMRVVVGCVGWKTPLLHSAIRYVVLNPAWDVPRSIAVREMLPQARRDPGYFGAKGLEVSRVGSAGRRYPVDASAVDWSAVTAASFPYRVRQAPGPRNPLGRIKFYFPNSFGVYLHGTPGRAALQQEMRAVSHGCMRVEDELALAAWALEPDPAWTLEGLLVALETARERRVSLPEPVPVHVFYFTAEVADDGALVLSADPYGWDADLIAALRAVGHGSRSAEGSR